MEAAAKAAERDAKAKYVADRKQEAESQSARLQQWTDGLRHILLAGLGRSAAVDLRKLRREPAMKPFDPGSLARPAPPPDWRDFEPPKPGFLAGLTGGKNRHQAQITAARQRFDEANVSWETANQTRLAALAAREADYNRRMEADRLACQAHNQLLEDAITGLAERQPTHVEQHLHHVLTKLPMPELFPRRAEVAYNRETEQVVVQFQLPGPEVVPTTKAVRYIQSRDELQEVARLQRETAELYRDVVAQVTLLALRDLFDADDKLTDVAFNGHVDTTNRATGQREYPCIVSLNVERAKFEELVLDKVSPADCLRYLNALVSPHPYELTPIRPVLDFDRSRYAFIEGLDAVATLDHRPDLMDMSYGEFEHLVRQIFEAMGMQGWTTTSSNDDGVDAVVFNPEPFIGGLTIIQAKHYKNVVGVNHIRELAGAMEEKKAGRGILVTTSWFTSGGWVKAREHGRMELVDGSRLIYLIKQHLDKGVIIGVNRPKNAATGPSAGG